MTRKKTKWIVATIRGTGKYPNYATRIAFECDHVDAVETLMNEMGYDVNKYFLWSYEGSVVRNLKSPTRIVLTAKRFTSQFE